MSILLDGSIGVTANSLTLVGTPASIAANSLILNGNTSGFVTLQTPSAAGSKFLQIPAANDILVGQATTDNLTNKTLTSPVFAGVASGVALPGTLTAGVSCVKNPLVAGSNTFQAHGLSAAPTLTYWYLECLSTEGGYAAGDRVYYLADSSATGIAVASDATNTVIVIHSTLPSVVGKATFANVQLTAAKWKLVATSYAIN
jgi:hypothetical protein